MATNALFDLSGRVCVVTGSTKGIGRAIAEGLASAGALVVVSSRSQDRCDEAAREITKATDMDVFPLACHVGDWDAIPAFIETIETRLNRIDVLVNNAGIFPAPTSAVAVSRELWRKVFEVNVEGPLRMSQCVAPIMRDQGGGAIVNIASMAAHSGGPTTCAYAASKAALVNMTKSMAAEWASWNIRVNAVNPGTFRTDLTTSGPTGDEYLAAMAAKIPLNRVATPAEIVGPVLYLASDASSFVTGDEIAVSGGRR